MKSMTAIQIRGKEITDALKRYRDNREAGKRFEKKWDKEADLNFIWEIAKRKGFSAEAVAGSFWFHLEDKRRIRIDAATYWKAKFLKKDEF